MKIWSLIAGLALVLLPGSLVAADGNNPDLIKQIASALQPVLAPLDPKAEITYSNDGASLVVGYRTRLYKIHRTIMTGEFSPEAYDEIGPSLTGFVLRLVIQAQGETNQATTP